MENLTLNKLYAIIGAIVGIIILVNVSIGIHTATQQVEEKSDIQGIQTLLKEYNAK